ncbi:MAG: hypothetical protein EP330_14075 [Deltaproteobacteria bacterium]|nr:MAG: hypothetical protein EP330_14075 [Deltaproteobacteria bacterium]
MKLDELHLTGWMAVAPSEEDPEIRVARLRAKLADPAWVARHRILVDADGVRALGWLFDTEPHRLGLALRTRDPSFTAHDAALLSELVHTGWELGASGLGLRMPATRVNAALVDGVRATRGREVDGRVEFKAPLAALPEEAPSPLGWRPASIPEAARLLERCSHASPDGLEPGDDADEVLAGYLSAEEMTTDPADCLHVGSLDGEDVALVCAQVEVASGWSTLTFMGLVPEARGQGLGGAVQRHGMAMLRSQGGTHYHGGTSMRNQAMRACFAANGVPELVRYRVFEWRQTGA